MRLRIWLNSASSSSLVGVGDESVLAFLDPRAQQDVERGIAAVVEDHVRRPSSKWKIRSAIVPVFLQRLALDGKDRRAARGDRGGRMVLGREDVARGPAHIGAQRHQRLDQNRGLDRHVQRAGNPRALQRLRRAEFLAQRHQPGHLRLGDVSSLRPKAASQYP
jgi:hypothetical protein